MQRVLRRVRRISHWEFGLGPTFQREMRTLGRKRGTYVARCLVVALLLGLVGMMYFGFTNDLNRHTTGIERLQALQQLAPAVTLTVLWFLLVVLGLLAPSLTAGAICDEKRNRTLGALLTTPLTAAEIVSGKLASALVQLLILVLTSLPLLLAIRVFGGVPTSLVLMGLGVVVATALLGMSAAMLFSVMARKPSSATGSAVGVVMVMNLAPVIVLVVQGTMNINLRMLVDWLLPMSAPYVMGELSSAIFDVGLSLQSNVTRAWQLHMGYTLGAGLCCLALAMIRFRAVMRSESVEPVEAARGSSRRRSQKSAEAPADASAPIRKAEHGRVVGEQPVLWRELHQASFRSRSRLIITLLAVFGLAAWVYFTGDMASPVVHVTLAAIAMIALMAQAAGHTTGAISSEREARTWDVLLTTRLTPFQIIWGKAVGPLRRLWLIPAVVMGHFALWVILGRFHPIVLVHLGIILATTAFLLCCSGVYQSLVRRKSSSASTANYLFAGALWLGLPLAMLIIAGSFRIHDDRVWIWTQTRILWLNPVTTTVVSVLGAHHDPTDPRASTAMYAMPWSEYSRAGFTRMLLIYCAVLAALGKGFVVLAVKRFSIRGGRTS